MVILPSLVIRFNRVVRSQRVLDISGDHFTLNLEIVNGISMEVTRCALRINVRPRRLPLGCPFGPQEQTKIVQKRTSAI